MGVRVDWRKGGLGLGWVGVRSIDGAFEIFPGASHEYSEPYVSDHKAKIIPIFQQSSQSGI